MTTLEQIATFANVSLTGDAQIRSSISRRQFPALFRLLGFRAGAEIGVWQGSYAETICQGLPGVRLRCVDPWQQSPSFNGKKNDQARLDAAYAEARTRLAKYDCVLDRRASVDAARDVRDGSMDFVYIDANHAHAFVLQDLDAWCPKVRPGGIVSGHDYGTRVKHETIEVKQAVDEFTARHQIAPIFICTGDKSPSFLWVKP